MKHDSLSPAKAIIQYPLPNFNFDMYDAQKQQKKLFHLHSHSALEINFVCKGHGINYIGNQTYHLDESDMVCLSPSINHMAVSDGTLEMKVIVFDKELIESTSDINLLSLFSSDSSQVIKLTGDAKIEIESIIQMIENEYNEKSQGYQSCIISYLKLLLLKFYRFRFINKSRKQSHYINRIEPSLNFMNQNLSSRLTLKEIANVSNMSTSNFSTVFQKAMKVSVFEYLTLIRIKCSLQLLKNTNQSILEISISSGFNNLSNFNHAFKKICGCTPREFRHRLEPTD